VHDDLWKNFGLFSFVSPTLLPSVPMLTLPVQSCHPIVKCLWSKNYLKFHHELVKKWFQRHIALICFNFQKPATGVKSANNGISEGTNSSSTRLLEPNPNHNPFGGTNHFKKVKAPARTFQFRNYSHTNPDEKEPEQTAERSEDASLEMEKIDSTHDDGTTATEDLHEPVRPRPPKDTVVTSQEKGTLEKSPKPESLPLIVNSLGEVNPFFATRAVGISYVEDEYSLEAQFTFGRRRPRRRRGVEAPRSISNVNPTEHRSLPLADIQTPLIELENNPNPPDPPVMSLPFMAIHSSTFDTERAWRLGLAKCTCGHYFPSTNENCDCGQMNPFFRFTT